MAAPSGTVWGSISNDYGRIGIYVQLTHYNTYTRRKVQVWFWSKYSVQDPSTTLYYDCSKTATAATTSKGSINIETWYDSSPWSTNNQQLLKTYTYDYTRGTSGQKYKIYAKLTNVWTAGTMTVNTSFTIPALESYPIYYMDNGGSGSPDTQYKFYGKDLTLSAITPTRSTYNFVGWGLTNNDVEALYYPSGTYTLNVSDNLYAIWKKEISLRYDNNGGDGSPNDQTTVIYNATTDYTFTISNTTPTRIGYDFLGWSLDMNATTASYQPSDTITLSNSSVLYAVWQLKTYQITYNANGGINAPIAQTKIYGVNINLSTIEPTRSGYKFLGWSTNNTTEIPEFLSGDTFTSNIDVVLYAIWEQLGIAYINVDGTFQAGKIWVNDYGTWMTGIIFVNDNETWKQGGI